MATPSRNTRLRILGGVLLPLAMISALAWTPALVQASTTITVTTVNQEVNGDGFCSLQEAIYAANLDDNVAPDAANPGQFFDTACAGGSGHDVIELIPMGVFAYSDPIADPDNFVGPAATPIITSAVTIEGRGAKLHRLTQGRLTRAFVVGQTGFLDLREVHVQGFGIRGGDGNDGGGGGMGAGGAIYVQGGRLLVQWSTFEDNAAQGGNGRFHDEIAGGGGGGLSGDGGAGANDTDGPKGGGGGGGSRGNGSEVIILAPTDYNFGGGGGGRVTSAVSDEPGQPCGGSGGMSLQFPSDGAEDGDDAPCAGGGGGGGTNREFISDPFCGGNGGDGAYGGGGGGGGENGDGGDGGFGGGGGGNGGDGGFGGGGGSEEGCTVTGATGQGGTFAGDGGAHAGGGGAGLGGAIFGYLATITIVNSTFAENLAEAGLAGGEGANNGRGAGGAVFTVAGSLSIESSTFADNRAVTVTGGGGGAVVVYDPEGTDEATLKLRNSIIAGNGASECYTRNGVTTSGSANNLITDSSANNLGDPACPGVIASGDPNLGALAMNAPGRTPTMAISTSSVAADVADGTSSPLDDQRGVLRPEGAGPDLGAYEAVAAPLTPLLPTTTIALVPASPNGSNGWYRSAVSAVISATDPDGTVAETRCALDPASAPASFAALPAGQCAITGTGADGQHVLYAASVDAGGNAQAGVASASFKIDRTAPVINPTANVAKVVLRQTGVVVSPNATDALSGVASASCGAVSTASAGVKSVTCTATDRAGNTATTSLSYVVQYRVLGVYAPPANSMWRTGSIVPVLLALGDATGKPIPDTEAAALVSACRVTFSASGAQSKAPQCLKYDRFLNLFAGLWKLSKSGIGPATITVSVSYPGTTVVTTLSRPIVIKR